MWKRLGVRARLVMLTVALFSLAGAAAAVYVDQSLSQFLEDRLEAELTRHARQLAVTWQRAPGGDRSALVHQLGVAAAARLTVIAGDGRVLADSEVDPVGVDQLDNHRNRPEVLAALQGRVGIARRTSTTVDTELLYLAVPLDAERPALGVARAAMPLQAAQAQVRRVRIALLAGGGIALLVALLAGAVFSHLSTLSLRRMVMRARALVGDEQDDGDELDYLMGSFDRMERELRRTLKSLAKARDRFEVVVEGMDEAVFRLGAKGEIKLANSAARELLAEDDEFQGRLITDLFADSGLERVLRGETPSEELEHGGRAFLAQLSKMRVSKGSVLVLHDVTDLRRVQAMRRDFVANVSHELRTPVSVIRANTEALIDDTSTLDDEGRRRFLEAVHRASVRIGRLVADLLDLARIESGSFHPKREAVRVADAIGVCADHTMAVIEEGEHTVDLELEDGVLVTADPDALEQILINLLENAAKYTPKGGHLSIRARRVHDGARVRIEVVDDGPGIAEAHRARLFERFYRVDPGRSKEMGGTGLGLAIVKHLVMAMDGEVGMVPNRPRGSIFWFELDAGEHARRAA